MLDKYINEGGKERESLKQLSWITFSCYSFKENSLYVPVDDVENLKMGVSSANKKDAI